MRVSECVGVMVSGCFKVCVVDTHVCGGCTYVCGCFKACVVDTHMWVFQGVSVCTHTCVGASMWVLQGVCQCVHIHMWVLQGVCQCVKVFQGELRTRVHNDITFIAT